MFVGNGLDRSGIGEFTAMINKIRTDYNIHRLEPEQASLFPTTPFRVSAIKLPALLRYLFHCVQHSCTTQGVEFYGNVAYTDSLSACNDSNRRLLPQKDKQCKRIRTRRTKCRRLDDSLCIRHILLFGGYLHRLCRTVRLELRRSVHLDRHRQRHYADLAQPVSVEPYRRLALGIDHDLRSVR